jgi:hypothetical protein
MNKTVSPFTKFLLSMRIIFIFIKLLLVGGFGIVWVVIKFILLIPKILGKNGLHKITRTIFDTIDQEKNQSERVEYLAQIKSKQLEIEKQKSKQLANDLDAHAAEEMDEAIDFISTSVSSSTSKSLNFISNYFEMSFDQIGYYFDLFDPNSLAYSNNDFSEAHLDNNFSENTLKAKGDRYEAAIGLAYENKGDLVIYNGFIKGMKDQGVDLVAISTRNKSIHLIQCKNWVNRQISSDTLQEIYNKLDQYKPYGFSVDNIHSALGFLQKPQNYETRFKSFINDSESIEGINPTFENFRNIINKANKQNYPIYKVLYIPKVESLDSTAIDLTLKKSSEINSLSYRDMSIVITPELGATI